MTLFPCEAKSTYEKPDNDSAPGYFSNSRELNKWYKDNSFGGYQIYNYLIGTNKFIIVDRCITSGLSTSEVSILIKTNDGIQNIHSLPLITGDRDLKQTQDGISITEKYFDGLKCEILIRNETLLIIGNCSIQREALRFFSELL